MVDYDVTFPSEVSMFTGIVEEVGRVTRIEQRGENRRITIAAERTPASHIVTRNGRKFGGCSPFVVTNS